MGLSISGIEMKRALERYGWYEKRSGASHWIMTHDERPGASVPVSRHREDLKIKTIRSILEATALTEEDIRRAK
jgi:predicted RNA binding protein YcfA (HicA-like mRNA interferase family)